MWGGGHKKLHSYAAKLQIVVTEEATISSIVAIYAIAVTFFLRGLLVSLHVGFSL